jgi:hypothetical protein
MKTRINAGQASSLCGRAGSPLHAVHLPGPTTARNGVRALPGHAARWVRRVLPAVLTLLALSTLNLQPSTAHAQTNYSIDWFTVDGGGGTSTGGVYAVSGTIGQPDAGVMSGGNFTLVGGFWGIIAAVQMPGAPYLWVMLTTTNTVCVWWAVSPINWQLQATPNLAGANTVWAAYAYTTNGANCIYIESPPTGNKFYRLKK